MLENMLDKEQITIKLGNQKISLITVSNIDKLLDQVEKEEDIPFWAELWPSALAMAEFLWDFPKLKESKVLELGAGIGLPGIVAAIKGAKVTQTDFIPLALSFIQENAALNKVNTRVVQADWRNFTLEESFDIILGSDILYEPKMHGYIKDILQNSLVKDGFVILADPGRESAQDFVDRLSSEGWFFEKKNYQIEQRSLSYKINIYLFSRP